MKLKELLKNVKLQNPQIAGNQIVVPLTSETPLTDVSEDMLISITSDTDYAHLTLKNNNGKPVIVPQGSAWITKKEGQDRATLKVNVVDCTKSKKVDVGCVQSSQGGGIQGTETDELRFIPATIRHAAMKKHTASSGHDNYSIIWNDIESYMKKLGIKSGRAHIHDFYDHYKKELEEFIAPFEKVENQVGAVILLNNEVVGIELYPNYGAWNKIWRKLIRDSYGSEAIALIKNKQAVSFRPILEADKISSMADLKAEVTKVKVKTTEFIVDKINPILDYTITSQQSGTSVSFKINTINLTKLGLIGQTEEKNGKIYYLSLFRGVNK